MATTVSLNQLISDFNIDAFKDLIKTNPLGELQYRNFFPLEFNPDLTIKGIESTIGAKVMASVTAVGSKADRKGRNTPAKYEGSIPEINIARDMTADDRFKLRSLINAAQMYKGNQGLIDKVIEAIYGDGIFCQNGVNARLEWMGKQVSSTSKFKTTKANNDGGAENIEINYGISTVSETVDWFAAATTPDKYNPITKFRDIKRANRTKALNYVTMDDDTFQKFAMSLEVQKFVASFAQNALGLQQVPTLAQVNTALKAAKLPEIQIWDSVIVNETKAGAQDAITGWELGNMIFHATPEIGKTLYTLSDEFTLQFGSEMAKTVADNFILVTMFGEIDPIRISTKGLAYAVPVIANPKDCIILKTKLA